MNLHVLIFLVLNVDRAWYNLIPEKFANIWRNERDEISAIKFEAARLDFLSDLFQAVAVVVAYGP